eukprot:scaffold68212_cov31-Tisochrysis_lutea.AAC.2
MQQAELDEVARLLIANPVERGRLGLGGYLAIDLRGVRAFRVRHRHAERVDIHLFVVHLIIQLGCHELGRSQHGLGGALAHERRQAQVPNLDLRVVSIDEDVVALEIAMDDVIRVEVREAIQDLPAPLLHHLALHSLGLCDVPEARRPGAGSERAGGARGSIARGVRGSPDPPVPAARNAGMG